MMVYLFKKTHETQHCSFTHSFVPHRELIRSHREFIRSPTASLICASAERTALRPLTPSPLRTPRASSKICPRRRRSCRRCALAAAPTWSATSRGGTSRGSGRHRHRRRDLRAHGSGGQGGHRSCRRHLLRRLRRLQHALRLAVCPSRWWVLAVVPVFFVRFFLLSTTMGLRTAIGPPPLRLRCALLLQPRGMSLPAPDLRKSWRSGKTYLINLGELRKPI